MKLTTLGITLLIAISSFGQSEADYLIRVCLESPCEAGTPAGYINSKGDTIVPIGHYRICFTDTIKHIGFMLNKQGDCIAIDNTGKYLYNVKWFENGPDYIVDGLFRIIIDGKTGFANEKGEIIIPPQFACTSPFENGKARVTYECVLVPNREHISMQSDTWFYIDTTGKRIE